MLRGAFVSIHLSAVLSNFIDNLSTTNLLDFHMFSFLMVSHNNAIIINKKAKTPTQSQFSAFYLACFYIHPYTNTAQSQSQLQNCNRNPLFNTQFSSFFLNKYRHVSLILQLILFFWKVTFFLPTTSTNTLIQAPLHLLYPPFPSVFLNTPPFFPSLIYLSVFFLCI